MKKKTRVKKTPKSGRKKPASKKAAPRGVAKATLQAAPTLPAPEKRSFWSFLGFGRKPKAKVGLMETRSK